VLRPNARFATTLVESGSYERSPARAERATPARWLLASPEHLSGATRAALGGELLGKLKKELADTPWVCGRTWYAHRAVWLTRLCCADGNRKRVDLGPARFRDLKHETVNAIVQLGRLSWLTQDRTRDISRDVRNHAVERLKAEGGIDEPMLRCLGGIRHVWSI